MSTAKTYQTIYESKKSDLKTRNRGGSILLLKKITEKLLQCQAATDVC